jgi:hypothetical protein
MTSRLLSPIIVPDQKELRDLVLEAEGYKDDAETAVTNAQAQVTLATTQAGIATTQAGIATTQAGIAATAKTGAETARDQAVAIVYGGDFSITAGAGDVPIADTDARLGNDWLHIGSDPNEIPLNQHLGGMAYQDPDNVTIGGGSATLTSLTATTVTGTSMVYNGKELNARLNPLAQAVSVQMTASASVGGIQQISNANLDVGTGNFTKSFLVVLPDYTPSAVVRFEFRRQDASNSSEFSIETTGALRFRASIAGVNVINALTTATVSTADNTAALFTVAVTRETASAAGSADFYVNGVLLQSVAIPAAATVTIDNTGTPRYFDGNTVRYAGSLLGMRLFNRALTAAEVLDLSINGVALADRGASQTPKKTFDFSAGTDGLTAVAGTIAGNIDGIGGVDNTCRLTATTTNSTRFVLAGIPSVMGGRTRTQIRVYRPSANVGATGVQLWAITGTSISTTAIQIPADTWTAIDVPIVGTGNQSDWALYFTNAAGSTSGFSSGDIFYIESGGTITQLGLVSELLASNAQSNTGQIIDSSGNRNHALLPASGAMVVGANPARSRQVRGRLSWSAANTLQHLPGNINQEVLPPNAAIEFIDIESDGSLSVNIGDGTTATRYASAAALVAGWNRVTLAAAFAGNTAATRKITVTPTGSVTAVINVIVTYHGTEVEI